MDDSGAHLSPRGVRPGRGYGRRVRRYLGDPQGAGRLAEPTAVGRAGSRDCGDLVEIDLQVEGGRIRAARFRAFGCPAAIAGSAELIRKIQGRSVLDAAAVGLDEIADSLELPSEKRECADIAIEALHSALEYVAGAGHELSPAGAGDGRPRVVVGMSGGVDSSVTALELVEQGYEVVGVTFRLWSDPSCDVAGGCCAPEGVRRARRVAHSIGAAHLAVDVSEGFRREVVQPFIAEYQSARTPNPCVRCNADFRFRELWAVAEQLGAAHVATGHYAWVAHEPVRLCRALDKAKDQSYVLAEVEPGLLEGALFPLGERTKDHVRSAAREAHLETSDEPESQEICFIPDDDYRRFLHERLGERPGSIVTTAGEVVGTHTGLHNFTVGQRRGLGISFPEPRYVVELRAQEQIVVVGSAGEIEVDRVRIGGVVRHVGGVPAEGLLQLRSTAPPVKALVEESGDEIVARLEQPVKGVAPGQCAVLYDGDCVVLAGTIEGTGRYGIV